MKREHQQEPVIREKKYYTRKKRKIPVWCYFSPPFCEIYKEKLEKKAWWFFMIQHRNTLYIYVFARVYLLYIHNI